MKAVSTQQFQALAFMEAERAGTRPDVTAYEVSEATDYLCSEGARSGLISLLKRGLVERSGWGLYRITALGQELSVQAPAPAAAADAGGELNG